MKDAVVRCKDLKEAIKGLERCIRDGEHLQTGKPCGSVGGLRSREILANWLLCAVINFDEKSDKVTFCSDPQGGDGLIYDKQLKNTYRTEHILVPRNSNKNQEIESLIIHAIEKKQKKGEAAYASGKILVVFLNVDNDKYWYPDKVAKKLPNPLDFINVWVVGLHQILQGEYHYNVTRVDAHPCPVWRVHIAQDFYNWDIEQIQ